MSSEDMNHLNYISVILNGDESVLRYKESTYKGSWKKAGGRSAWFMFRRNMDRLIQMMAPPETPEGFDVDEAVCRAQMLNQHVNVGKDHKSANLRDVLHLAHLSRAEDIFAMIREKPHGDDGTVLACLRDLRRYATLIEAEMISEGCGVRVEGEVEKKPQPDAPNPEEPMDYKKIFLSYLAGAFGCTDSEAAEWWEEKRKERIFGMSEIQILNGPMDIKLSDAERTLAGIKVGDRIIYREPGKLGEFGVLRGFDRTEVCARVEFDTRPGEIQTVPLMYISIDEPKIMGSADGGAHHESTAPWFIHKTLLEQWKAKRRTDVDGLTPFYVPSGTEWYRLYPLVYNPYMDHRLNVAYTLIKGVMPNDFWLLNMDKVPASIRDDFPRLQREMNLTEFKQSNATFQFMYESRPNEGKYVLREQHAAWGREA